MESFGNKLCRTSLNHFQFVNVIFFGFHTVAQYSRLERTIVMYAIVFVSWLPILRLRLRKPSMLFDLKCQLNKGGE